MSVKDYKRLREKFNLLSESCHNFNPCKISIFRLQLKKIQSGEDMKQQILSVNEIKKILFPIFKTAPVYRAVLFGSYAKGNPTDKSDVDIVIDSKGELLNMDFYGVLEDITTRLDKRVDLFEITELKNNPSIQSVVQREGIVLYERQR